MSWKRMKGMVKSHRCPVCHGEYSEDEYDLEEDMCDYCLYPEAARKRPSEFSYKYGDPVNRTISGKLLDSYSYTREKQSSKAGEDREVYNKIYKKRGN